jgi:hypothetical protein
VDPFPEKGEAGLSVDLIGSIQMYVVTELKETGSNVAVPAFKEERKDTQKLGPLVPQRFELYVSMSSVLMEENYIR